MDGPTILLAIRTFVALLGVAAVVAIVVRPLRLPYSVALVLVGLAAGLVETLAIKGPEPVVPPEVVLVVLLPGLVFEAGYRLDLTHLRRSLAALLFLAAPGVLISAAIVALVLHAVMGLELGLAFIVGAMVSATDPAAVVSTFRRLTVPRDLATDRRGREPAQRRDRARRVRDRDRCLDGPDRSRAGARHVHRGHRRERRHRAGRGIRGRPADGARGRPSHRADDLGRARVWDVPAGRRNPRVGDHRHRRRRDRPGELRPRRDDERRRYRRPRHGLGVPGLPVDRARLPARRARLPDGRAGRLVRLDPVGRGRRAPRPGARRLRPARVRGADRALPGRPGPPSRSAG